MRLFKPGGIEALNDVSAERIAEICRVHITTARRYKRGEEPPFASLQLLKLCDKGELGVLDLKWAGWHLRNGQLISPDGQSFAPGDVLSTTYWQALAKSYQTEQRLPRQGDWIDEKWKPAPEQTETRATA